MSDDAAALADMDRAIAGAEVIVAGIRDGQRADPTPCAGVDVRTLVIIENLGHGWDLARATGQPAGTAFPDDVTERALATARQFLATRPAGAGAPFAPEVPVPADAPAIDRLAGFLGRTV